MMDVRIKVLPNSRKEFVEEGKDGRLIVAVKAPREEGKANERLLELCARHFSVPLECVRIVRGKTESSKTIRVQKTSS